MVVANQALHEDTKVRGPGVEANDSAHARVFFLQACKLCGCLLHKYRHFSEKKGSTSHKLQQKRTQLILFPEGILIARKKVLRNPLGGRS